MLLSKNTAAHLRLEFLAAFINSLTLKELEWYLGIEPRNLLSMRQRLDHRTQLILFLCTFVQPSPGQGPRGHVGAPHQDPVLPAEAAPDETRRTHERPRIRRQRIRNPSARHRNLGHDRPEKLLQHRVDLAAVEVSRFVSAFWEDKKIISSNLYHPFFSGWCFTSSD